MFINIALIYNLETIYQCNIQEKGVNLSLIFLAFIEQLSFLPVICELHRGFNYCKV
jgi:hypothetical protein